MAGGYRLLCWVLGAVVLLDGVLAQTGYCPDPEDIAPCTCSPPEQNQTKPSLACGSEVTSNEDLSVVLQASYPTYDFLQFTFIDNSDVTNLNVRTNLTFEKYFIDNLPVAQIESWFLLQFAETLRTLTLSNTDITDESFPFDTIPNLVVLESLELISNPGITVVPEIVSSSLRILDLSYCSVLSIPSGHLAGVPNYVDFFVDHNNITAVGTGEVPLAAATRTVVLEFNHISAIDTGAFTYTSLEEWEASDWLALYLGDNELQQVPAGAIALPRGYVFLTLRANQISYVEPGAFVFLDNTTGTDLTLHMGRNALTEISEDAFREILQIASSADFNNNPLSCGCDFAWIALDEGLLNKLSLTTECSNGTRVSDLNVDAFLSC